MCVVKPAPPRPRRLESFNSASMASAPRATADRIAAQATALLADPKVRERMSAAAAAHGVRDAGARLADMVELAIR